MSDTIELKSGDGQTLSAYLAEPERHNGKSIVVLQEIFGVNAHIKSVCDRYAEAGYRVVAPALFDRVERNVELAYDAEGRDRGISLMAAITDQQAMSDVNAAKQTFAGGPVSIVGYCWGGSLSWLAAAQPGFDRAVAYYGGKIVDNLTLKPQCPVLMHFGDLDKSIPPDAVASIEAATSSLQGIEIHRYENAGHGFNCDVRESYDKESSAKALERTLQFLG